MKKLIGTTAQGTRALNTVKLKGTQPYARSNAPLVELKGTQPYARGNALCFLAAKTIMKQRGKDNNEATIIELS